MNAETGIINIRGRQYQTVALRVQQFRQDHPDWSLTSDMIDRTDDCVVMRAMIANDQGRVLATGFAEEYRKSSQINKTSALENAETSAIGRALAALGYGGTEYATANEVQNAIHQQGAARETMQNSAVSSPPPDADEGTVEHLPPHAAEPNRQTGVKLQGKWTSITGLEKAIKEFATQMDKCATWEDWNGLRKEAKFVGLLEQAERDHPDWWNGWIGMPERFVPLRRKVEILETNLAEAQAQYLNA